MALASASCEPEVSLAREAEGCQFMAPLAGEPIVDGTIEQGLALLPLQPQGWTGPGSLPSDVKARYATAWRKDGLYAFVAVDRTIVTAARDMDLFCGDAVEVFVDDDGQHEMPPAYDDPGAVQLIVTAPGDAGARAERYRTYARLEPWRNMAWASVRTATGYVVEAFIAADDLDLAAWSLMQGTRVGLNIAVDVAGPTSDPVCEGRLGQFVLRVDPAAPPDMCALPYCNVNSFCTATLEP